MNNNVYTLWFVHNGYNFYNPFAVSLTNEQYIMYK